ncbi:SsgA family sporulation/cell division regulator [Kitasatospora sp. NBC_00315]|uniref:SsgA family sporulation/cell division regulator n=1 Tax=Kitasatospora sp. NBC_00315 TaxID=2975963 RepID=UPI00324328C6
MRFLDLPDEGVRIDARVPMDLACGLGLEVRLQVGLAYRADDPMVLRLTFDMAGPADEAPVTWVISRELLLDGLDAPTGEGDVHVRPDGTDPDVLRIILRAPTGTAELRAPAPAVHAVLLRSDRLVPFGEEFSAESLERELALLLQSTEG